MKKKHLVIPCFLFFTLPLLAQTNSELTPATNPNIPLTPSVSSKYTSPDTTTDNNNNRLNPQYQGVYIKDSLNGKSDSSFLERRANKQIISDTSTGKRVKPRIGR
jgi:hypothetical protein